MVFYHNAGHSRVSRIVVLCFPAEHIVGIGGWPPAFWSDAPVVYDDIFFYSRFKAAPFESFGPHYNLSGKARLDSP
jgi:hypothetical protein